MQSINSRPVVKLAGRSTEAGVRKQAPAPQPSGTVTPTRVLHYVGCNFGLTGIESFVLHLCEAQMRSGLKPSIMLDVSGRETLGDIAARRGITLHPSPTRNAREARLPGRLGAILLGLRRIGALLNRLRQTDVLHIHESVFAPDALLAAWIANTPRIVVTHHGSMRYFKPDWNFRRAVAFWLEKRVASRIVLPYRALEPEYLSEGVPADRISIAPFCVDERAFSGLAAEPNAGELTLVMAARMVLGKGHTELVDAFARLAPGYPGLKLLIAGDGPTRPEIEAQVARLGLQERVTFEGHVSFRDMPSLLRRAHVIALPSYMSGETFPLCLLEGMAVGLPAIGARWFGISDIIEDGVNGVLVEPRDSEALARAIERFLTEPGFYAKARSGAVARFRERYSATSVSQAYMEFYGSRR
jgi:glycosyltransferase involved in cell wall biosynthesis